MLPSHHSTMEPDERQPQRESLRFEFDLHNVPPDMSDVMLQIKEVAEKLLYHWSTFPIVLPPSITETQQGEGREEQGVISFKDLFMAPTFDELEEVALDDKGLPKKLSEDQLHSIRQNGEFAVPSIHFPGQVHKWRLSGLLQKGIHRARDTMLDDMALALRLLIITARKRFYSHFFSLSQSAVSIKTAFCQLLDVLIGIPSTTPGNLFVKLQEEHSHLLVAELKLWPLCKRDWVVFTDFIKDKCNQLDTDRNVKTEDVHPPPAPYRFQTPKGVQVDLRLFNRDLMNKCTNVLKLTLEKESRGWYIKYKDRLITDLKGQDLSYEDITRVLLEGVDTGAGYDIIFQYVNRSIREEYLRRVFESILRNDELEALQPKIGLLLVQQAKAALVMGRAIESIREKLLKHQKEHKALLVKTYSVKSRILPWMNERLQEFKEDYIEQNQWCAHLESIEECRHQGLDQAVYFLQRDLIFLRDMEPVLKEELSKVRNPTRVFEFSSRIWLLSNWVVKRHQYGETEVIPTVIVESSALSAGTSTEPDQPTYSVEKYTKRKTSTRYPFWRWINYCHRTWAWTWNTMFWLGLVVPWCSPVGLRALFFPRAFTTDLQLHRDHGSLYPKVSSKTETLLSRLYKLWEHVLHSRAEFESNPDTGFLGKSFTRIVNRVWNYFCKGFVGSVLLVTAMTPVCLIVSSLSLLTAATAPMWMPVVTAITHLAAVLFYDFEHPDKGNAVMYIFEAIIFRLLIGGILQPVCAFFTGLVACPVAAFFVMLAGFVRRGLRSVWDAFMFHAVIKKRGRVPCSDSFVVRRIEGPGLASNYFYQVKPEQALAAVEAKMELHEINAWSESVISLIEQPKREFRKFVKMCFKPFSASLVEDGVYKELDKETHQLLQQLKKIAEERKVKLSTGLTDEIRRRVKLSARELKVTISQTAKMLENCYRDHVLRRLSKPEEEFWETKHLDVDDWQGLATQLLTEVFSSTFLTPLEDTDTCFTLEVQHLNLSRYLEMLKSAEFRDDLDVVSTVHTPKGDIDVDAPYLEEFTFSPYKERINYADTYFYDLSGRRGKRWPWQTKTLRLHEIEKLEVPIPIPHPSLISVIVHNRDNDQDVIELSDPLCRRILRAAEQLTYVELRDPTMVDLCETEASTPDHTTCTTSEPDAPLMAHLAEPERAFSDDMAQSDSRDSTPDSACADATLDIRGRGDIAAQYMRDGMRSPGSSDSGPSRREYGGGDIHGGDDDEADDDDDDDDDDDEVRLRVVYRESEADTSCVVQVGDEEEEDEDEGGARGRGHNDKRDMGRVSDVEEGTSTALVSTHNHPTGDSDDDDDDDDDNDDDDDDDDEFDDAEDDHDRDSAIIQIDDTGMLGTV